VGSGLRADHPDNGGKIACRFTTYTGRRKGKRKAKGFGHKLPILALVERGGEVRSFHVQRADMLTIMPIVNIAKETAIATDEGAHYNQFAAHFAQHERVHHTNEEWVRGDVHTNTVEGYFSLFKRGLRGVYQHCSERHLHRYLAEFDFRYNNRSALGVEDEARTGNALKGAKGKRLTYRKADRPGLTR
jgi:hypothetical protein